jgi:hypothetical protein
MSDSNSMLIPDLDVAVMAHRTLKKYTAVLVTHISVIF